MGNKALLRVQRSYYLLAVLLPVILPVLLCSRVQIPEAPVLLHGLCLWRSTSVHEVPQTPRLLLRHSSVTAADIVIANANSGRGGA